MVQCIVSLVAVQVLPWLCHSLTFAFDKFLQILFCTQLNYVKNSTRSNKTNQTDVLQDSKLGLCAGFKTCESIQMNLLSKKAICS